MTVALKVLPLNKEMPLPSYAHEGDAGLDLCAAEPATIEPYERKLVPCGICLEIPDGYAGLVIPRSGLAIKHGISIVNAPGLIDSGYRGEIKVVLINLDPKAPFVINEGDRIAQLMIVRTPLAVIETATCLEDSERGAGGFGSSGMQ